METNTRQGMDVETSAAPWQPLACLNRRLDWLNFRVKGFFSGVGACVCMCSRDGGIFPPVARLSPVSQFILKGVNELYRLEILHFQNMEA